MANVGKQIKKLRTAKKMTQDQLAEQLFVSRQTVSNYEMGRSNPDIDMLVRIAEIFETDVNNLIYGPPVAPNRKRQRRRALILTGVTVLCGVLTAMGTSKAQILLREEFEAGFLMLMAFLAWPVFMFLLGWTVMELAECFLGAKRLERKWFRWLRWGMCLVLAVYLVVLGPYLWDMARFCMERILAGGPISKEYSYGNALFNPIYGFAVRHMQTFRLCFFLLGGLFWFTKKKS